MFSPRYLLIIDHEPRLTALVRDASAGRCLIKEENRNLRALHLVRHFQPDLSLLDVTMADRFRDQPRGGRRDRLGRLFRRLFFSREAVPDPRPDQLRRDLLGDGKSTARKTA